MSNIIEWSTLIQVLISSTAGGVIGHFSGKRKSKAEVQNLEQQATRNVLEMVNAELTRYRDREESTAKKINDLERQDVQNRLTIHAMEVELSVTRDFLDKQYPNRYKFKIFVLDDYEYVLKVLKMHLGKISLIDVQTFDNYRDFVGALGEKPEILIIDYNVDGKHTASDVLDVIEDIDGYQPKIIIMSGFPEDMIREKIAPRDVWRIYNKDGLYVYQISKEIMDYVKKQSI